MPAVIRALRIEDLPRCLELSTEANWNQTETDWQFLLRHGRGYGIETPDGVLAGTTMTWEWGNDYSWIDMVLVAKSARGKGYARQLMEQCLRDVSAANRGGLLDATDMGQRVYAKLGFAGKDQIARLFLAERGADFQTREIPAGLELSPLNREDVAEAARLDARVLGVDRRVLLQDFQRRLPQAAWKLTDKTGELRGFVLGRDGRVASQIGSLVAGSDDEAIVLVGQSLKYTVGPAIIDVPVAATAWNKALESMGFKTRRSFLRMGRDGAALPTDWSRLYAISGPDFG